MFNVFSQTGLPGFRVRPQDDVPGFNVDENGLPRRDSTWPDGTSPGSATPQQVTPVNCTTVNGSLDCTSPGGVSFGGVKASPGFPERLDSTTEDKHAYSVPDGPYICGLGANDEAGRDQSSHPRPHEAGPSGDTGGNAERSNSQVALQPIDHAAAWPVRRAYNTVRKNDQSRQVLFDDRPEWPADRGQCDGARPHAASWLRRALRHSIRRGANHPERRRGVGKLAGIALSAHASSGLDKQRLEGSLSGPFE